MSVYRTIGPTLVIISNCLVYNIMNVFARFDGIASMTFQVIKETKCYGRTFGWTDRQRENIIPAHKHSLRGGV